MSGKLPAILNVNGHGPGGKAVEHKQKRCINQARRGIIALNLEWFGFGELDAPGNNHTNIRLLDLAGVNGLGLFYLEMRRGLDYLYGHPKSTAPASELPDCPVVDGKRCCLVRSTPGLAPPFQLQGLAPDYRHRASGVHRGRPGAECP